MKFNNRFKYTTISNITLENPNYDENAINISGLVSDFKFTY